MSTAADKPAAPAEKKSFLDRVVTITPVVMAIVATLLAGLSSSEMTKAQYHRSLAGQNQSKAGDQWGYFQAKASRRTQMENSVGLIPAVAKPGPVTPEMLTAYATRLTNLLLKAQPKVEALKKDASDDKFKAAIDSYLKEANELELPGIRKPDGKIEKRATKLSEYLTSLDAELKKNKDAFRYLGTGKLPDVKTDLKQEDKEKLFATQKEYTEALENPEVKEVIKGFIERKSESEIAPAVRKIPTTTVHTGIEARERMALAFERVSDPIEKQIAALGITLNSLLRQAGLYHNMVVFAEVAAPSNPAPNVAELDDRIRSAANDLNNLYQAAAQDYNARRYRIEANNNRDTASMYEMQVHRSSAESDAHLKRSGYFFYGMLGAQCGVAIGSIALAARRKGLLWGLATTAGVLAAGLGTYVYLTM